MLNEDDDFTEHRTTQAARSLYSPDRMVSLDAYSIANDDEQINSEIRMGLNLANDILDRQRQREA